MFGVACRVARPESHRKDLGAHEALPESRCEAQELARAQGRNHRILEYSSDAATLPEIHIECAPRHTASDPAKRRPYYVLDRFYLE